MTIYTIRDTGTGETFEFDTFEDSDDLPSGQLFDYIDRRDAFVTYERLGYIEGASEALVAGSRAVAETYLTDLGLELVESPSEDDKPKTATTYLEFRDLYPDGEVPMHLLEAYDEARTTHALEVLDAAERLADTIGTPEVADEIAHRLTCIEAESIVHLLHAVGDDEGADAWLNAHIWHDSGDDVLDNHGIDKE